MKSFFKKIIVVSFLSVLILNTSVFAQATGFATPEELKQINEGQEVYVKDLLIDKYDYSAGDTIRGSFVLLNSKDFSVSNLSFRAFLVGDLMEDTSYRFEFDSKILGNTFLDKNEIKKVNFEYTLPKSSSAYTLKKQLGIKIRAFSGSGLPLGWADTKINVADSGLAPIVVKNAFVSTDQKS